MPSDLPDKPTQTRCVTVEYLDELQAKANSLTALRRWINAAIVAGGAGGASGEELRGLEALLDLKHGELW